MNYAEIKYYDIANGLGVRTSLFVSGCSHRCHGCFNDIAWDFHYGKEFTRETMEEILKSCEPGYIRGLSLLGGEPLEPVNQRGLLPLVKAFKERFPRKDIWCYTGYTYEQLCEKQDPAVDALLGEIDVLIDGPFLLAERDLTLRFRGSTNQRMIDIPRTRETGEIVLWE